jgi:IS30 family transposase
MVPAALRKGMPKGRDLSDASRSRLIDDAALLKNGPRRTPGRRTPAEANGRRDCGLEIERRN